jgi:Zn-dependent M28 family amino/carboxypeptidase
MRFANANKLDRKSGGSGACVLEFATISPDPIPEEVIFIRSDQYSFVKRGVPAVFMWPGMQSADPKVDGRGLS